MAAFKGRLIPPYQTHGVNWLAKREMAQGVRGGMLCDEMGLGKTVQLLATIVHPLTPKGPTLVVCPSSLVGQWQSEIDTFILGDPNIKIISYSQMISDKFMYIFGTQWTRVIFDEAHEMRNKKSIRWKQAYNRLIDIPTALHIH